MFDLPFPRFPFLPQSQPLHNNTRATRGDIKLDQKETVGGSQCFQYTVGGSGFVEMTVEGQWKTGSRFVGGARRSVEQARLLNQNQTLVRAPEIVQPLRLLRRSAKAQTPLKNRFSSK